MICYAGAEQCCVASIVGIQGSYSYNRVAGHVITVAWSRCFAIRDVYFRTGLSCHALSTAVIVIMLEARGEEIGDRSVCRWSYVP